MAERAELAQVCSTGGVVLQQVGQPLITYLKHLDEDDKLDEDFAVALHDNGFKTPAQVKAASMEQLAAAGIRLPVINLIRLSAGGLKRSAEVEEESVKKRLPTPEEQRKTLEDFRAAMTAVDAPHSLDALLRLFDNDSQPMIPVTPLYYDRVAHLPEASRLFVGYGEVAEEITGCLRSLALSRAASAQEATTTVEVTGELFTKLFRILDNHIGVDALNVDVLLNRSVPSASSSLHSAVEANTRPDAVLMSKRMLSLGVIEDKKSGDMLSADHDLKRKLAGGLFGPAYQGIPAIAVAAVAGSDIKFGLSDIQGQVSLMPDALSVCTPSGAITALVRSCLVYRILRTLQRLAPTEIKMAAFGCPIVRPEKTTILLSARKFGVLKTIADFDTFSTKFGVTLSNLQAAYSVKSPFLPECAAGYPDISTTRAKTYRLQMMTYGYEMDFKQLVEEEVALCVYAWLSVAHLLHAKGIVARDFGWRNMLKQQPRPHPSGAAANPAYSHLKWIPLVIDLELAGCADEKPTIALLRDWQPNTLQDGQYKRTSDLFQVGVMLQQWSAATGVVLTSDGDACLRLLLGHTAQAADIAATSPWLADARAAFLGLMA